MEKVKDEGEKRPGKGFLSLGLGSRGNAVIVGGRTCVRCLPEGQHSPVSPFVTRTFLFP